MKYLLYLILFIGYLPLIESQCAGGIWAISDTSIGSFTVSWRYNIATNTVQFVLQGQAATSINLASTYIALGWSDTAPTMANMDAAIFYPSAQTVQDRFSRARGTPALDAQQDFCLIRTNLTDQNIYVSFERFVITGDTNDISFNANVFLTFAVGSYTSVAATSTFNPQYHSFRTALQTSINLLSCTSTGCSTTSCTTSGCPCIQQISTGTPQCFCFPASPCISGSTITPRVTTVTPVGSTTPAFIPTANNGSCQTQINACAGNGICLQISINQFICQCRSDFTGSLCQTSLITSTSTSTNQCQCLNGGICLSNGSCLCSNNFRGRFCQLNNPCLNYCRNNGVCSVICNDTSCATPICACQSGFMGLQCETVMISPCQSNPCVNGNCTATTNGTFQCQCNTGFSGRLCDLINTCLSNPCNQGTCIASSNCIGSICGYSCLCPPGVNGTNCEIGANLCWSAPCRNGGTCIPLSGTYLCQCPSSYGGTNCDVLINICTPNPCLNNGVCLLQTSTTTVDRTYRCECALGFVGTRCEYVSGCNPSPCRNSGQCTPSTSNCSSTSCTPTCVCPPGYTGSLCEQQDTSCLTLPCFNGGTCIINSRTNVASCQCPLNVTGLRCETVQSACSNNPCANNGVCYIDASFGNNTARCLCLAGYTGPFCQTTTTISNACSSNPCGWNGTCVPLANSSYYCTCSNGFVGQSCGPSLIGSCANNPCHYLSTCQNVTMNNTRTYRCFCPEYLTGDRCQFTNPCQRQPCFNQGTCIPLGPQNNFMCMCPSGFGNHDCSVAMGLICNANTCLNGGTCFLNNTNTQCLCPPGFAGARCEWTSICSSSTCLNGGTCRQIAPTMVECLCVSGFTGPTCALRDSCTNFPCNNGGGCASLLTDTGSIWSSYRCTCPAGTFGQNCDRAITSCASIQCPTFQICNEQPTGPICTCSGNKVGTFCQYDNPCTLLPSTYCSNGGTCITSNTDPPIASCLCRDGFTGSRCTSTSQNDLCASTPCQGRGVCALSTVNTSYACVCQANFIGDQCERTNPCLSSPCANQGICIANWNNTSSWFSCRCLDTFTGSRCETSLLNPCSGLCMNGSPCVNGICVCPARYTGTFCGFNNPCFYSICRNGGTCTTISNSTNVSFLCNCLSIFTGQFCETQMVVTAATICSPACQNGGSCVLGVCQCTSQYVGSSCEFVNPCITRNPCLNSGTCFGRVATNGTLFTQCFCLQGYTGELCESTLCTLAACNGGTCIPSQNSFVCVCPTGRTGDRCQFVDLCASNPCSSIERCEQTNNQYQCVACFDQSSFCSVYQTQTIYCNNRFTLQVNNSFLPVLQACPRSCGQCSSSQRLNATRTFSNNGRTLNEEFVSSYLIDSFVPDCVDRRNDCEIQKTLGFCDIFNEKYPQDCMKTCHPNCNLNT